MVFEAAGGLNLSGRDEGYEMRKLVKKFKDLPTPVMILHITGKFLFGVGVGLLVASYFHQLDWWTIGAWVILISLITQIPGAYFVLRKKYKK